MKKILLIQEGISLLLVSYEGQSNEKKNLKYFNVFI